MMTPSGRSRRRKAAGPERPLYLTGADTDRVMAVVLALMSEVSSLRDRLDAHERVANTGALPTTMAIETYVPSESDEAERASWRQSYIRRILRVVTEEVEPSKHGVDPNDDEESVP